LWTRSAKPYSLHASLGVISPEGSTRLITNLFDLITDEQVYSKLKPR